MCRSPVRRDLCVRFFCRRRSPLGCFRMACQHRLSVIQLQRTGQVGFDVVVDAHLLVVLPVVPRVEAPLYHAQHRNVHHKLVIIGPPSPGAETE